MKQLPNDLPTGGDARELLEQIKRTKEGLAKTGKGKTLKVTDEVRMVAEVKVKYGNKIYWNTRLDRPNLRH